MWMNSMSAAAGDLGRAGRPGRPGGEHDEQGPQALAPGADDVFAHLVDEQDVARQLAADFSVDRGKVVGDEGPYVVELHGIPPSPRGRGAS